MSNTLHVKHPTIVAKVRIGRTDGTPLSVSVLVIPVVGVVSVGVSGVPAVIIISTIGHDGEENDWQRWVVTGWLEQQDHCLNPDLNMSLPLRGNWVQERWRESYTLIWIDGIWSLSYLHRTPLSIPSAGVSMVADDEVQPLTLRRFISCFTDELIVASSVTNGALLSNDCGHSTTVVARLRISWVALHIPSNQEEIVEQLSWNHLHHDGATFEMLRA